MHLYSNTLPCSHQWEYKTETTATHRSVMRKCRVCGQSKSRRVKTATASQKPLKPRKTTARKAIRKVSDKQKILNKEYAKLRKQFLAENPVCAVFPHLPSDQVHHQRGRAGKLMLDTQHWLAVSAEGHRWIHDNPKEATELGLLVPRLK